MEKINFQKQLMDIVSAFHSSGEKPSLLLHSCCGPCSSHCLDLLKDYFEITVFYYNPNIYPAEEYYHRLSEQTRLIDEMNSEQGCGIRLIAPAYDHQEFLCNVTGLENEPEGGARCAKCFELRLHRTYETAVELGIEYIGTTLTVSPHKNALVINSIGSDIAIAGYPGSSVKWLPSDFKKNDGYKHSIELSKQYSLYRQNYCGCEYSIWF